MMRDDDGDVVAPRSPSSSLVLLSTPSQSLLVTRRSIRTTNAIERRHEKFKRRIKIQCVLACADTGCRLFWALPAGGEITLRKSMVGNPWTRNRSH